MAVRREKWKRKLYNRMSKKGSMDGRIKLGTKSTYRFDVLLNRDTQ